MKVNECLSGFYSNDEVERLLTDEVRTDLSQTTIQIDTDTRGMFLFQHNGKGKGLSLTRIGKRSSSDELPTPCLFHYCPECPDDCVTITKVLFMQRHGSCSPCDDCLNLSTDKCLGCTGPTFPRYELG